MFAQVPVELRRQVNGEETEAGFRFVGWELFKAVQRSLAVDQTLLKAERILDFGAGLGRLSLPLLQGASQAEVTLFEQNPSFLGWAQKLLNDPRAHFTSQTETLKSRSFELIIAITFFTHVDQTRDYWLSEIERLMTEDGVAFLSYQDEKLFKELKGKGALPTAAECPEKYVDGEGGSENDNRVNVFYRSVQWKSLLSRYFDVTVINPRALFGHQSISVIRRRKDRVFDRAQLRRDYESHLANALSAR